MTAQEKYEMIMTALTDGKTVYVATYLRCAKITAKTLAKWAAAGIELFRVRDNSLYMGRGRSYDCIDYCAIRVVA